MDDGILNSILLERQDLSDTLSIVRVRPDQGPAPAFKAGQFVKLGLPRDEADTAVVILRHRLSQERGAGGVAVAEPEAPGAGPTSVKTRPRLIRRAYSIASSANERDYLELFVVLVETGKLTPRLWTVRQGGRLWMDDQISGQFTLDDIPPDKELVMVATGTGIAPFLSMLRTYRDEPRWRQAVLINGVRYAADLGYRQELEDLARSDPRFTYVPIVSREPEKSDWPGQRGRVQRILDPQVYRQLIGAPLDPDQCHVMLCGNPEMITSVQALLEQRGFRTHARTTPGNIHFERYW